MLDGWGVNIQDEYNAVFSADTPVTDSLGAVPKRYRTVRAHGTAVGLPSDADMGNSEVGHNALGSGQVIDQGARLVDLALSSGQMFKLPGWELISKAFADNTVHFIGLLSDGGVHSRYDQLLGCVRGAAERGAKRIRVHILTDGRDVPDGSSIKFTQQLQDDLAALAPDCDAKIASGGGRMCVTMDRYEVRQCASRQEACRHGRGRGTGCARMCAQLVRVCECAATAERCVRDPHSCGTHCAPLPPTIQGHHD